MAESRTSFRPGTSGNPGGRPASAGISELARRYTVDALSALVRATRNTDPRHAATAVAAARELIAIGYPGLSKADNADPSNALHLHLSGLQQVNQINIVRHTTEEPRFDAPEAPEIDAEALISGVELLPPPNDESPDEALALWEAAKARKRAIEDAEASRTRESTPATLGIGDDGEANYEPTDGC